MGKIWLVAGVIYGFLGVALGAFGAHALKEKLAPEMLAAWRTGVEYQFYHALALVLLALLVREAGNAWHQAAGACFTLGVLLFSGSLYALALSGMRVLGAITPLGGLLLLAGWACLLASVVKAP